MTTGHGDFVLPVDKPEGPTSHDVVGAARRALGVKRIGHTGTLDPFASGLLLLCVGKATRLAEYFSGMEKSYEAVARLGVRTDTLDRDGEVVAESGEWGSITMDQVNSALAGLRGEIDQLPPAYSAKKVGGERAYERARQGKEVRLEPCRVTVTKLEITTFDLPHVGLTVTCSSGTYVRSLARDIGDALGVGAHLTGLRRTHIGEWEVGRALPTGELADKGRLAELSVAPLDAVRHLPRIDVDDEDAGRLRLGQPVSLSRPQPDGGPFRVAHDQMLLAIGDVREDVLRPRKVFAA